MKAQILVFKKCNHNLTAFFVCDIWSILWMMIWYKTFLCKSIIYALMYFLWTITALRLKLVRRSGRRVMWKPSNLEQTNPTIQTRQNIRMKNAGKMVAIFVQSVPSTSSSSPGFFLVSFTLFLCLTTFSRGPAEGWKSVPSNDFAEVEPSDWMDSDWLMFRGVK